LLQGEEFAELIAGLPGYEVAHGGEVLSLTRALPWWNFRTPREHEDEADDASEGVR